MHFKAPIRSRPSDRLVHVPREELGRQIHGKARSQSHVESDPARCGDPSIMRVPWPRAYADLRKVGVRGEEAAEHLKEVCRRQR